MSQNWNTPRFKPGDKVHYVFDDKTSENGIVTKCKDQTCTHVVFECSGNWDRYMDYPADFDIITPEGSLHEKDQEEKLYNWGLTHYTTGIYFCLTHNGNTVNDITVVLKIIDQLVTGEATFVRL